MDQQQTRSYAARLMEEQPQLRTASKGLTRVADIKKNKQVKIDGETLYIAEGLAGSGFRCGRSGRLVLARADCGMEGEPEAVRDVADEAVEDALRDGARVVVVPHPLATMPMDGFAATLRFQ